MITRNFSKIFHSSMLAFGWSTLSLLFGAVVNADPIESSEEPLKFKKFVVTGSHIPRADIETALPVRILDRKAIDRSGATTLTELFRDNVLNTAGMVDEQFTQNFAPASAGINLRGLGLTRTLVLVDGNRMPIFPFGQSTAGNANSDSFVDINLIPLGAVERVEIFKDGASAIYGSDAIAGVVNIITRKDYDGILLSGQYGQTLESDGEEGHFSMSAGKQWDKLNVTMAVDYTNRDEVKAKDRSITKSANGPIDDRSNLGNPGTFLAPGPQPDPRCPTDNLRGPFCTFDFAPANTLIPEIERTGAMLGFEFEITDQISMYARSIYSHSESERSLAPTGSLFSVSGDNPNTPFPGQDISVIYRALELGPRVDEFETDAYNVFTGIVGNFGTWEMELGGGVGDIDSTDTGASGFATQDDVQQAIDDGILNPFGDSPNLVPGDLTFQTKRKGESRNHFVTFKANGEVIDLPFGTLGVAIGGEYRQEEFSDQFDPTTASGVVLGTGGTSADGDRRSQAGYVEFSAPVYENLEAQFAARYDNYSDFGGTFNPKYGLRWQPLASLLFRGSYGTGFKAPGLHELHSGDITSFDSVFDSPSCDAAQQANDPDAIDQFCNNVTGNVEITSSGNPNLDAEDSESFNLGMVFDVTQWWNVGIDYWRIRIDDAVVNNPQFIVDNPAPFSGSVTRDSDGLIVAIDSPFVNAGKQKLWGIDMDSTVHWESTSAGDFQLDMVIAYLGSFNRQQGPGQISEELAGHDGFPEWRGQGVLSWNMADYFANTTVHYVDGYDRRDGNDRIGSWTTVDLQLGWSPSYVEGTTFVFGIDNVFDQDPPEDPFLEGWPFINRALHSPRGRFLYFRAQYER